MARNNKYLTGASSGAILSGFVFAVLFILVCGSYISYNSNVYEYAYKYNDTMSFEWLYSFLSNLGYSLHIQYKYFSFILYGLGLLLLKSVVSKFLGPNEWIFYLLFFLYPLAECRSALRNSMVMFIIIYAYPYLLRGRLRDLLFFLLLLIIATGFHRTAYFYFLFLLYIPYKSRYLYHTNFYRVVYFVIIAFAFIACFIPSISNGFQTFFYDFLDKSEDKALNARSGYFTTDTHFGFLLYGGYQLLWILLLYMMKQRVKKKQGDKHLGAVEVYINLILFMDIILLPLVIGYKFNGNFFRLFMNIVPLNYIGLILLLKSTRSHVMDVLMVLFLSIIMYVGIQQSMFSIELNIHSMFVNNWLLKFDF